MPGSWHIGRSMWQMDMCPTTGAARPATEIDRKAKELLDGEDGNLERIVGNAEALC